MVIKSCHVKGFGCFTDREFRLDEGLNVFVWPNGEGKSTFSDFITAMLYGLATARKTSVFSVREKYKPFDGGAYGGTLILSDTKGGRETVYRIERSFDAKTATGDTLKFYINDVLSEVQNVGQHLLGISEETFRRVFFLNSEGMIPGGTEEISSRIANYMGAGKEQVAAALKLLDERKRLLKLKRGRGGEIWDINQELDSKRTERSRLLSQKALLKDLYESLKRYNEDLDAAEKEKDRYREIMNRLDKWQAVEGLENDLGEERAKLDAMHAAYGGRLPDEGETDKYRRNIQVFTGLSEELKKVSDGADSREVDAIKEKLPCEEREGIDMETPRRMVDAVEDIRIRCGELKTQRDLLQKDFDKYFSGISGGALSDLISNAEKSYVKAADARKRCDDISRKESSQSAAKAVLPVILILAGILLGAGAAVFYLLKQISPLFFGTGLGSAAILLAAGVFLLAAVRSRRKHIQKNVNKAKSDLESALKVLSGDLSKLGYEGEPFSCYTQMCNDISEYNSLSNDLKSAQNEYGSESAELTRRQSELTDYFTARGIYEDDFKVALYELRQRDIKLREHAGRVPEQIARKADLEQSVDSALSEIRAFMDRYGISTDVLSDKTLLNDSATKIIVDRTVERQVIERIESVGMTLKGIKEGIGSDIKPVRDFSDEDVANINLSITDCSNRIASVKREIYDIEVRVAEIDRIDSDIRTLEEKLADKETLYNELSLAYDKLDEAQKNLIDRYIGPVREHFMDYSERIREASGIDVNLDKDLNVHFFRGGVKYSSDYLSTGETAVLSLCLKLSVADFLTGGNASFMILDDPFTALDKDNFDLSSKVIDGIDDVRQIIYFTCHESRSM